MNSRYQEISIAMHQITIQDTTQNIELKDKTWFLNSNPIDFEVLAEGRHKFQFLMNGKPYAAEVVELNKESKTINLSINNKTVNLEYKTSADILIGKMGYKAAGSGSKSDLKAPMPGLIKEVLVKEGDTVTKGDILVILEAMKMENALKSLTSGKVKKIAVSSGDKVEKNTLLVSFE